MFWIEANFTQFSIFLVHLESFLHWTKLQLHKINWKNAKVQFCPWVTSIVKKIENIFGKAKTNYLCTIIYKSICIIWTKCSWSCILVFLQQQFYVIISKNPFLNGWKLFKNISWIYGYTKSKQAFIKNLNPLCTDCYPLSIKLSNRACIFKVKIW